MILLEKLRKYSRKREAILDAIRGTTTHPSAEWVYAKLKPEFPDLSLGTVYRNIAEFHRENSIMKVATVDGKERYDGDVTEHPHFICGSCGRVLDIGSLRQDLGLSDTVARELGAEVDSCSLTFCGVCAECLSNKD